MICRTAIFIVLPGGFSYGDYLRSGAIARFSPIMQEVIAFANKGGFVFGVCNGFQILAKQAWYQGIVAQRPFALQLRERVCSSRASGCATDGYDQARTSAQDPDPNTEKGRYYTDAETLRSMEANGQILFRYCDASGQVTPEANPNGSSATSPVCAMPARTSSV